MRRVLLCSGFVLILAASLIADSNLRIADVGLHGYYGTSSSVRLIVRNPSSQVQTIDLRVAAIDRNTDLTNTTTSEITLSGGELRELEIPILMPLGKTTITADATSAGVIVGQDTYDGSLRQAKLIVLMCASENVCKTAQSQIQFAGTIEERADKNRQSKFETVDDPRDHWWAYSASTAIVLAMPMANFTAAQRDALEGFLRVGGRLVLLESEIADTDFLRAYRTGAPQPNGERVGRGTLFRVSGPSTSALGDVFAGRNLPSVLAEQYTPWNSNQTNWLSRKFAVSFDVPRLRWIVIWLAAYTLIIGAVNFAVLRRLRRLEFGWISVCALALLFAAGFYFSSASRRPETFRLDNLATYNLDSRSPLAAANYNLRVSAPQRVNVLVSVDDPAVFTYSNFGGEEPNSQIWAEIDRQTAQVHRQYDIRLGPPRQVELSLLKWSFHDLDLQGLHEFAGTVHFVAPNRIRNDTGQQFSEAVYLDYTSNALYPLPALAPGQEIQLDTITPTPIRTKNDAPQLWIRPDLDYSKQSLRELVLAGTLPLASHTRVFAGISDGPGLPVELNLPHQRNVHSLFVVGLEQP